MTQVEKITQKLRAAFAPVRLEVVDESARHAGHAGARPEGETHFKVTIASAAFTGLSRVECHRKIYTALDEEMKNGVHALAIEVHTC